MLFQKPSSCVPKASPRKTPQDPTTTPNAAPPSPETTEVTEERGSRKFPRIFLRERKGLLQHSKNNSSKVLLCNSPRGNHFDSEGTLATARVSHKTRDPREKHSMDQYRSRPKLSENFERHWSIRTSGEIHMDQSLVHAFSWGNLYGPMVLKVLQKFPPTLVLVHGWLFPGSPKNLRSPKVAQK